MTSPSYPVPTRSSALRRLPWWAVAVTLLALFLAYAVLQENGLMIGADAAHRVHEFFHDGRHALGVPCH